MREPREVKNFLAVLRCEPIPNWCERHENSKASHYGLCSQPITLHQFIPTLESSAEVNDKAHCNGRIDFIRHYVVASRAHTLTKS
jgi:hypothetical protein